MLEKERSLKADMWATLEENKLQPMAENKRGKLRARVQPQEEGVKVPTLKRTL